MCVIHLSLCRTVGPLVMFQAAIGLKMDGKLPLPKFDFDCEEVRYNHRFAPFGSVSTPPPMHYMQFKVTTAC